MYRILLLAVGALALSTDCYSDEAARKALAEELMGVMKVQESMEKSLEAMKQMIPMQIQQQGMTSTDVVQQEKMMTGMMQIMSEEINYDKIRDDIAAVYADVFTEEELTGISAFYRTSAGQKFIEKQPELMMRSMQISQKRLSSALPIIMKRIEEMKAQEADAQ